MDFNTSTIILDDIYSIILFVLLMAYFFVCLYLHYSKEDLPSHILQQILMDTQDENIMTEKQLEEELKWLEQIRNVSSKIILELDDLQSKKDNKEEIDITKYKIAKFGEKRYAMLRDCDLSEDVDLYAISDYLGSKDFKIVSIEPVGKFNKDTKKVKIWSCKC
jgi:hypothetical protein